ncbi:transposase [Streptomyces sp. NPDC059455]|uniref:transposase n=1 Tax=Streptomyces sp. NPDC059455 TaxID=3346837 RepID=UPI00367C5876
MTTRTGSRSLSTRTLPLPPLPDQRGLAGAVLTAIDLLAGDGILLLHGELADAEPKKLRYRLLHTAARLTRGGRRLHLKIAATWPWRHELAKAFASLATLPRPVT